MSEVYEQVKIYTVRYVCNQCKKGYMIADNGCLTSCPPLYRHQCSNCGHKQIFEKSYPCKEYK